MFLANLISVCYSEPIMKVRYLFVGIAIIVSFALFAFLSNVNNQPALISYAFTLDERGQLPGEFIGKATSFDIQRSLYRNVSVTFDKKTQAHIQSITGMVGMRIASLNDTLGITISNLEPNTKYYKYVDHLDNLQEITADEAGSVTFQQDASQERYIMIFTHPSTYFIEDNVTGGDCNTIGSWNTSTKTCTLNKDTTKSIEIKDNGITLDGDNHTVQGPNSNIGIYVNGGLFGDITDVTVKNIIVKGFSKGIQINNTNNVNLINVITSNNADGTEFYRAENSSIIDSSITSNTSKGLIIGTSSDINAVTNNTITSNGVGIDLGLNSQSSISRNNITLNGNGITVSAIGGTNTFLWQNNLNNTNQVSILFDGDTQFYKDPPTRGNFWADHACTQDVANNNICTNKYLIKDRLILSDIYDKYPWACKDGWIRDCPVETATPTPTPTATTTTISGIWAVVRVTGTNTTATMYKIAGTTDSSQIVKILPPGWALEITGNQQGASTPILDHTDRSSGFIATDNLDRDSARQQEFASKTSPVLNSIEDRKKVITEAVEVYYKTSDEIDLYHQGGGLDGKNDFSYLINGAMPKELILAMTVHESARTLDNTICNGVFDGGVGILQITTLSLKGLGSGMRNATHTNDCNESLGWSTSKPYSDYYSNTLQGIYANVKDGLRVLQEKYRLKRQVIDDTNRTTPWFEENGITIDNTDLKTLAALRRYNGGGENCLVLNYARNAYLKYIGDQLKTIDSYFPSYPYSGQLDEKLLLGEREKANISICSPGSLQIEDSQGNITGYTQNGMLDEIPNILFFEETMKDAEILFPQEDYIIRVFGTESGTYNLYETRNANDYTQMIFHAVDIPLKLGEIHEYHIHFDTANKIITSKLLIDKKGKEHFENTIEGDEILTYKLSDALQKIIVCHNIDHNPHSISISKNALQSHLAHGDKEGECSDSISSGDGAKNGDREKSTKNKKNDKK